MRSLALILLFASQAAAQGREAEVVARDFHCSTGEVLPEVRIHYTTLGTARKDARGVTRNAVLILPSLTHGDPPDQRASIRTARAAPERRAMHPRMR